MSSFARNIQKRILSAKQHTLVPILYQHKIDDDPRPQWRPPFSMKQIAFIGNLRATADNIAQMPKWARAQLKVLASE